MMWRLISRNTMTSRENSLSMPYRIHLFLLFSIFYLQTSGFQVFLSAKSKKCFREDIPLSTDAILTYTVTQGAGFMPVTLNIRDLTRKSILTREAIDHGFYTFRSPNTIPNVPYKSDWSLRDENTYADDDAYFRVIPDGSGDDRIPYVFCFEHLSRNFLPNFHSKVVQRRIIFDVKYGVNLKTKEYYDNLAKEKHLTSTEKSFRSVEDRVSDLVRLVDEMRQRELRLSRITKKTQYLVTAYSIITCISIILGAIYSSKATFKLLVRRKMI